MPSVSDNCSAHNDLSICKLAINGDLASFRVKKLEDDFSNAISSDNIRKVVLDLTSAQNIDSPGLALCVGLYKECQNRNLEFEIYTNADIWNLFKLVNLDRILPIKEVP